MSITAYLQLNQWQEHQLPDTCDSLSHCLTADGDFVISRTATGEVVSRYKDDSWNMKVYDAQGVRVYNFVNWAEGLANPLVTVIAEQMKRIQLARLYLFPRPRKPKSVAMTELKKLASLALKNNISMSRLFENENLHRFLLPGIAELELNQMKMMLLLLKELFDLRVKHPDFKFAPADYAIIERIQALYDKHPKAQRDDPQQTKLIPSRLYAAFIAALNDELDAFNAYGDEIVEFYQRRKKNSRFGATASETRAYKDSVAWSDSISQLGLGSFFDKQSVTNWSELLGYLSLIQIAAKYWIHFFSGMRANEARHLPADAYMTISAGGSDIIVLRGYTSKIAGQNHTETFWITTPIAEKAVVAARHIGTITALLCDFDESDLSQYPLFPALIKKGDSHKAFKGAPVIGSATTAREKRLIARWPDLLVKEADIRELEQFDGFRDWRNDPDVKVGQPWPLATHQCRRSLAVYAARSGMVSVGSLGLQFKHLTEVMASYYRRGSALSLNFLQTDEAQGWLEELEYERLKSQYIDYDTNVINSTSRLWGGEGNRIQVARDKGLPLIITTDRAMTEQRFIKGEMTYKLGPIGGCTNLEPCDKISFTSVFACIDCEKSILDDDRSLKNIQRGLNNLKRGQSLFVPDNPHYKQLDSEISEIYNKLERRGLRDKMGALA